MNSSSVHGPRYSGSTRDNSRSQASASMTEMKECHLKKKLAQAVIFIQKKQMSGLSVDRQKAERAKLADGLGHGLFNRIGGRRM